jgi:UDPglucose 6-dehydrogenase
MYIKIGIIGGGFVGSATYLFNTSTQMYSLKPGINTCICYDLDPAKCIPENTQFSDLRNTDVIFICVPTPMNTDGSCYTGIVEKVINQIRKEFDYDLSSPSENQPHIVVRSTVPVGFCERMGVHFMPEFLTEKNWKNDFYNCDNWIIGLNKYIPGWKKFEELMINLLSNAEHNENIKTDLKTFMNTSEAEMVKYFRNCFLATKVAFANEMYRFCEKLNLNYNLIKNAVIYDKRIGHTHLDVPGYDGKFGFNGTCLPKDCNSLKFQFDNKNIECPVLTSVINRNEIIDNPSKDWMDDKGRASV